MIHPVTVKDPKGKVKHVFDSEFLENRSKTICMDSGGHFASHKLRSDICGRKACKNPFTTKQRGKIYCSKTCSEIVGREVARATKARQKEKKQNEKESHEPSGIAEREL
jgi:hypothetical protein